MTLTKEQIEAMRESLKKMTGDWCSDPDNIPILEAKVDALCGLALQALDMQPRPIVDAPKDGTLVVLWGVNGEVRPGYYEQASAGDSKTPPYEEYWADWTGSDCHPIAFTAFSSLPTPEQNT